MLEASHHFSFPHKFGHHLLAYPTLHLLHRTRHPPLSAVNIRKAPAPEKAVMIEINSGVRKLSEK